MAYGHCIGHCIPSCATNYVSGKETQDTCTIFHLFKQSATLNVTFSPKVNISALNFKVFRCQKLSFKYILIKFLRFTGHISLSSLTTLIHHKKHRISLS